MYGHELVPVLKAKQINFLFHANTVLTSCTFLQLGGLAARGYVERRNLKQSSQPSDNQDKRFGIWQDIFLDGIDIHDRASNVCYYGPVLFRFPVEVLNALPPGSEVRVTKVNPKDNWADTDTNGERYYVTPVEVDANLRYGDFGKSITIRTPDSFLAFPENPVQITLDNATEPISPDDATPACERAKARIAAVAGPIQASITPRNCLPECRCHAAYAVRLDKRFWFDT